MNLKGVQAAEQLKSSKGKAMATVFQRAEVLEAKWILGHGKQANPGYLIPGLLFFTFIIN